MKKLLCILVSILLLCACTGNKVNLTVEDGEPVMYVPEVVAIKDGKIVGHHLSLVDSFDSSVQNEMNEDQKLELINIYLDMIKKLQ